MILKKTITILIFSCFCLFAVGQSGIQFYTGITNATNKDKLITPEGLSHPGWHVGADARLIDGKMFFVLGGQYHQVEFIAQDEKSYYSVENSMTWLKLRAGLGYQLFKLNNSMVLRAKTLVSFNFISGVPTDTPAPYTNYNSGTVGGVIGFGLDLFNFTIDAEIENGFFKAVNMVSGTEVNFFTLSLGYKI